MLYINMAHERLSCTTTRTRPRRNFGAEPRHRRSASPVLRGAGGRGFGGAALGSSLSNLLHRRNYDDAARPDLRGQTEILVTAVARMSEATCGASMVSRSWSIMARMVRYRRDFSLPAAATSSRSLFQTDSRCTLVDNIVAHYAPHFVRRVERPFAIDAIVVLPEHLHAISRYRRATATPAAGGRIQGHLRTLL